MPWKLLPFALLIALVACGGDDFDATDDSDEPGDTSSPSTTDDGSTTTDDGTTTTEPEASICDQAKDKQRACGIGEGAFSPACDQKAERCIAECVVANDCDAVKQRTMGTGPVKTCETECLAR